MKGAISYLRKHHVLVAGFQELEGKQAASLRKRTKNRWVVVGAPSRNGKKIDTRNSIGYRKTASRWCSAPTCRSPTSVATASTSRW